MLANHRPDAAALRLGAAADIRASLVEAIAATLGDPAYLNELGDRVATASRKQVEKAMTRLLDDGRAVAYGGERRRLYAAGRRQPGGVGRLPARAVRVLQYLPLEGKVELWEVESRSSQAATSIAHLARAGIAVMHPGRRKTVELTPHGREVAATLGDGLRLQALMPWAEHAAIGVTRHRWTTRPAGRDETLRTIASDVSRAGLKPYRPTSERRRLGMTDRELSKDRRIQQRHSISLRITRPWTMDELGEALDVTRERVRQILGEGFGHGVGRLASSRGTMIAADPVVDPRIEMTTEMHVALRVLPAGWFRSDGTIAIPTLEALSSVGMLDVVKRRGSHVYRVSQGGLWAMSCLGHPEPARGTGAATPYEALPEGVYTRIHDLAVAMAIELADAHAPGPTVEAVNAALGNAELPRGLRVELAIANAAHMGMLEAGPTTNPRKKTYRVTNEGRRWAAERGVTTTGACDLVAWLGRTPTMLKGSGLPSDAPRIAVTGRRRTTDARTHLRLTPVGTDATGTPRWMRAGQATAERNRRRRGATAEACEEPGANGREPPAPPVGGNEQDGATSHGATSHGAMLTRLAATTAVVGAAAAMLVGRIVRTGRRATGS